MENGILSLRQKIAYALPAAPIAALGLPILVYLPPFYETLGLSLSLVGIIFMLNRFWDVITDPVLGVLSDHFPSRWGRRRHWLVISAPILMLSTYMLFFPMQAATAVYLAFWLFVLYIGYTLITLSHMSWGTELSSDYNERSAIHGVREILIILGMISAIGLPAVLELNPWSKETSAALQLSDKVESMGIYVIAVLPISLVIALWNVGEKKAAPPTRIPWSEMSRLLANNKPLRQLLSADLLVGAAVGITGSLYLYFYSSYLKVAQYSSTLLLFYFFSGCIAIPLWIKLAHKWGKHRAFAVACAYSCIVLPLVLIIPKESILWAVFATTTQGLASGAGPFLGRSMMADITDKHNLDTGSQRTGLFFAALTLTNKVGAALAVGIAYIALDWVSFKPTGVNSDSAIFAMSQLFVWIPVCCMLPIAVFMWNYALKQSDQREYQRLIALRDDQFPPKDKQPLPSLGKRTSTEKCSPS